MKTSTQRTRKTKIIRRAYIRQHTNEIGGTGFYWVRIEQTEDDGRTWEWRATYGQDERNVTYKDALDYAKQYADEQILA